MRLVFRYTLLIPFEEYHPIRATISTVAPSAKAELFVRAISTTRRCLLDDGHALQHARPTSMGNTAGVAVHNPTLNVNPSQTNVTNTNTSVTFNVSVGAASEDRVAVMAGAAGGAAFGAALGGTAGALVGAALGAGAGMVRAHVGRRLPEPDAPGYPSAGHGTLHPRLVTWLPDEQLRAIAHSAAASDGVACAVCLERQTAISLQPCGHACLCGACALQIRRRAAGSTPPLCPVCRNPATGCHRVFLS